MKEWVDQNILDGETFFLKGNFEEAKKIFLKLINWGYELDRLYNNIGVVNYYQKRYEQSFSFFIKALEYNPNYKVAIYNYYKLLSITTINKLLPNYLQSFLYRNNNTEEIDYTQNDMINKIKNNISYPVVKLSKLDDIAGEEKDIIHKMKSLSSSSIINGSFSINKPHRNIIITGIPGSGYEQYFKLLSDNKNFYYSQNTIQDVSMLPELFYNCRKRLMVEKKVDEDVIIGINVNLLYLSLVNMKGLERIINELGYRVIAITLNPVKAVHIWNQEDSVDLPEFNVSDKKRHPVWKSLNFISKDKIDRQAIIWERYAQLFMNLQQIIKIYTYEQLTHYKKEQTMKDICNYLNISYSNPKMVSKIGQNIKTVILNKIKDSINLYCPTMSNFGYRIDNDLEECPAIWDKNSVLFCRSVPKITIRN